MQIKVSPNQVEHHGLNAGLTEVLWASFSMTVKQVLHDGDGLLYKQRVWFCNGNLKKLRKNKDAGTERGWGLCRMWCDTDKIWNENITVFTKDSSV